jgi:putative colanic acid biosynthesis acetyltransferase WcaF
MDLSRFNNSNYDTGANSLIRILWYFVNILVFMNPLFPLIKPKPLILRIFGAKIGQRVIIKPRVNIKYPWRLSIGDNSWVGEGVWIDNLGMVTIGSNCCLSQGCLILCGNHDYKSESFDLMVGDVFIEDGSWIGAKSTVTGGVRCGFNSVLAVGSVASGDLTSLSIYRGNPAQKVRDRVFVKTTEIEMIR